MYLIVKKISLVLALSALSLGSALAAGWDEDQVPAAGSVVNSDGSTGAVHRGFYLGLEGGGTLMMNEDFDHGVTLENDPGYNAGIVFGYDYKWLRLEEEINAARNNADKLSISGFPDLDLDGDTTSYNAMTNLILNIRGEKGFGVFAGVGVGASHVVADYAPKGLSSDSNSTTDIAGQALAGVSYAFNSRVELDLEYRYMDTKINSDSIPDYQTQNLDLGLKFFLT